MVTAPDGRHTCVPLYLSTTTSQFESSEQQNLTVFAKVLYEVDCHIDSPLHEGSSCSVQVPVTDPAQYESAILGSDWNHYLNLVTGKTWTFKFVKARAITTFPRLLGAFPEMVLYSGGLDGYVGLAAGRRLDDGVVAVHISTNTTQKGIAKRVGGPLRSISAKRTEGNFSTKYARTRPFVFLMLAVASGLPGRNIRVTVAENQIGALNYNYTADQPYQDRSTGLRPTRIASIEKFLQLLLAETVSIYNPFVLQLKSEMISQLTESEIKASFKSVSCHRADRNSLAKHCGYCSSCLLRRQSYLANGIMDQTSYSNTLSTSDRRLATDYFSHGEAILRAASSGEQAEQWLHLLFPG